MNKQNSGRTDRATVLIVLASLYAGSGVTQCLATRADGGSWGEASFAAIAGPPLMVISTAFNSLDTMAMWLTGQKDRG